MEDYKRENEVEEELEDPFLMDILILDDFLTFDQECEILNPQISSKSVNFIARSYAQDSKRYKDQTDYWLKYLAEIGVDQESPATIRKAEALKAASLID